MTCKYCGSSYEENDKFCPICGRSTTGELEAPVSVTVYNDAPSDSIAAAEAAKNARNNIAITSFVLGIVSMLMPTVGMLFGTNMAGLLLGIFGVKSNRKGFSVAGIVMNIIATCIIIFAYIVGIALLLDGGVYSELYQEFGY